MTWSGKPFVHASSTVRSQLEEKDVGNLHGPDCRKIRCSRFILRHRSASSERLPEGTEGALCAGGEKGFAGEREVRKG